MPPWHGFLRSFETLFVMTGYSLWAPWYPPILADSIHATPEWLYNSVLGLCILAHHVRFDRSDNVHLHSVKWRRLH